VEDVRVNLKLGRAQVYGQNLNRVPIVRAIHSAGYQAEEK
jgi:hypothetical protein